MRVRARGVLVALLLALAVLAAACGDDGTTAAGTGGDDATATPAGDTGTDDTAGGDDEGEPVELRLGYFPNVTHAPAIVGLRSGLFEEALGANVTLTTATFSTGTAAIEAMFSEAIDATFIGPNPAINGWAQSEGTALHIVAGSTSGGAALIVRDGIESAEDLRGTRLATPSLGNTQDVAVRAWLAEQGLETDLQGGGDVQILPQENAQTLETFIAGEIDGAWVPEPWASRLVLEGGGTVFLDERDLWPDGQFVTTHLIVAKSFLEEHPDVVQRLLTGHVAAVEAVNADPAEAQRLTNEGIEEVTDRALPDELLVRAWDTLTFTVDPIASSLQESADDAQEAGLLDPVDLNGIYALDLLNEILSAEGRDPVPGLVP